MKIDKRTKAAELVGKRLDVEVTTKAISIDEKAYTATFVMSTSNVDRHGDIVEQDSWNLEHFKNNPAFFWGHRSNEFPLGKWLEVSLEADPDNEGELRLVGTAEFAVDVDPEITRAWNHVVRGDLNMVSVGFIPHVVDYDEEKDAFMLKSCELMECSLVGIGSNRQAVIKDTVDIKQEMIDVKEKVEDTEPATPVEAVRKANAIAMLNKAIRQYKK